MSKDLIMLYKHLLNWKSYFVSKQWRDGDDIVIVIAPAFYSPYAVTPDGLQSDAFRVRLKANDE